MDRCRAAPTQNETTRIGFIFRVTLNYFSCLQYATNIIAADLSQEHVLYGVYPENKSHRRVFCEPLNACADFAGVGSLLVGVVRTADQRTALDVLET